MKQILGGFLSLLILSTPAQSQELLVSKKIALSDAICYETSGFFAEKIFCIPTQEQFPASTCKFSFRPFDVWNHGGRGGGYKTYSSAAVKIIVDTVLEPSGPGRYYTELGKVMPYYRPKKSQEKLMFSIPVSGKETDAVFKNLAETFCIQDQGKLGLAVEGIKLGRKIMDRTYIRNYPCYDFGTHIGLSAYTQNLCNEQSEVISSDKIVTHACQIAVDSVCRARRLIE